MAGKLDESNIIERLDALPGWGGDTTSLKKTCLLYTSRCV